MRELELMGTLGCHLCDVAASVLMPVVDPGKFELYQVDIADDDQLMEKYAVRIPVLVDVTSEQELEWPFDEQQAREFLLKLLQED
ncbi:glutaredoxin family protein [Neptuniibacter sp.]|uniref:glutaredoxin family protein n=1 Tax=Neptuniibacter sp. TaxID=1962643 RepID=UPI003B5CD31C